MTSAVISAVRMAKRQRDEVTTLTIHNSLQKNPQQSGKKRTRRKLPLSFGYR